MMRTEDKGKRYRKIQNRQRIQRGREKHNEILPGVTNSLPRGGEVSSMFMLQYPDSP